MSVTLSEVVTAEVAVSDVCTAAVLADVAVAEDVAAVVCVVTVEAVLAVEVRTDVVTAAVEGAAADVPVSVMMPLLAGAGFLGVFITLRDMHIPSAAAVPNVRAAVLRSITAFRRLRSAIAASPRFIMNAALFSYLSIESPPFKLRTQSLLGAVDEVGHLTARPPHDTRCFCGCKPLEVDEVQHL